MTGCARHLSLYIRKVQWFLKVNYIEKDADSVLDNEQYHVIKSIMNNHIEFIIIY